MLELEEYQEYEISPSVADLRFLIKLADEKKLELLPSSKNTYKIKLSSYVGFIHLSSTRIYLKPKISMASIFYLISRTIPSKYITYPKNIPPSWFDTKKEDHLAFVKMFMHIIDNFVKYGLRRGYEERVETLLSPRGTLLIPQNARKPPWKNHEFDCSIDDFSFDIYINRIIKYTVDLLRRTLRDSSNRIYLNKLERQLTQISTPKTVYLNDLNKLKLNRQYVHYEPVIAYCKLVIGNLSLDEREGNNALSSFLINMNTLYESFVFNKIKHYYTDYKVHKTTIEVTGEMGKKTRILVTEPDVKVDSYDSLHPKFVADAKYKFLDLGKERMEIQRDFYQILSYALFTKSQKAILFYPQYQKIWDDPVLFNLSEYGVEVMIISLPLGGLEWSELDNKIEQIMKKIDNWI